VMESVLLILFCWDVLLILVQTTLVDSRNLVIFSTFWYFFACLFSNCLAKYLVGALWKHWKIFPRISCRQWRFDEL
jgi:hypothetical protein